VNPFEDVPGFQVLGLLRSIDTDLVLAVDDSLPAIEVLSRLGARVGHVPHPSAGLVDYARSVRAICTANRITCVVPATDAHLVGLALCLQRGLIDPQPCHYLQVLCDRGWYNKWAIQDSLSVFGCTPARWPFETEADLLEWERLQHYPVVVKGMRKGAVRCHDTHDALAARRHLLANPANQGDHGGTFLESYVDGEEHSVLFVTGSDGCVVSCLGVRKLATTQLGTTLMAVVEDISRWRTRFPAVETLFRGPGILEIESRIDRDGREWFFEANIRFPSWIGALGSYGAHVLRRFLEEALGSPQESYSASEPPAIGSVIYRLPTSGIVALPEAFQGTGGRLSSTGEVWATASPTVSTLWRGLSPRQFRVK
jgi:hypothetical protein